MQPIIYKGQKVITTELLAQAYETDIKNIQSNFARNEKYFEEGVHYFKLEGDLLREFKNEPTTSGFVGKTASCLYLWTERGANRHCKILDTDKAWEQFDNLEETYFRVKSGIRNLPHVPPTASPGGIAALISTNRRIMHEAGNPPAEIAAMAQSVLIQFGISLPEVCAKDPPEQMSLFGQEKSRWTAK